MNARQVIENAAGKFDTPAQAILARCEQSGIQLRLEGEHLKAKGSSTIIAAWQPMIQRHKSQIIAFLASQDPSQYSDEGMEVFSADYKELTECIIELCQLVGYSGEVQEKMLAARENLYPCLYATECSYFRLQVIRAKAGTYWASEEPSQMSGITQSLPGTSETRMSHPARRQNEH